MSVFKLKKGLEVFENVSVKDNEWIYYVVVYTLAW